MLDDVVIGKAAKAGKLIEHDEELHYSRFREDAGKIPRGTVLIGDRVVWGYQHIPRIFRLSTGIPRNISNGQFYAEEKIDGFNVRIVLTERGIYALSRGGFLDLFATEKVRTKQVQQFFSGYPRHTLCGEMIGNTPYTKPTKKFDVKLFIYDSYDDNGNLLPCEQKYAVLKKYGLLSVPVLGKCNKAKEAEAFVPQLIKGKKEGMVLKSADRKKIVKFVVPSADIDDLAQNAAMLFDMPSGFLLQRVFRSAISIADYGLPEKKYYTELGKAVYAGLIEAVKSEKGIHRASEEFEITVIDNTIWNRIAKHMSKEVKLEVLYMRKQRGVTRIRFRKIYKKTDRMLRDYLGGKELVD